MKLLQKLSEWIFVGILAYAPLHIFLSTWIGTSLGALSVAKGAKDVLVVIGAALAFGCYAFAQRKAGLQRLYSDRLVQGILAYTVLTVVMATVRPTDTDAEVLGVVFNLRFLLFFVYGVVLTRLVGMERLRRMALRAVFMSGLVVLLFGVVQYLALPNDALRHVGYSRENGVLPAFFIDDKPDLERIMSTQRDPNSFGSYVLVLLALSLLLWLRKPNTRKLASGFIGLSVLCLWFTFSRSAWIGAGITGGATFWLVGGRRLRWRTRRTHLVTVLTIFIVAGVLTGYAARNTYLVQNIVLHADQSTTLEDPNQLRVRFFRESIQQVAHNPLGSGPGTAGLASIRNNIQGTRLNENYYLQIATEVGVVGLALFLAILLIVGQRLYRLRDHDWLAAALLASFLGLAFTNILVHIWATEAVACTWWGLAGVAMGVVPPSPRNKKVTKSP